MNQSIKEVGERALLELFESLVDEGDLPFNEDAMAYPLTDELSFVINIDTFVAKTDAPPGMAAFQMGAKAATMAISDLAAKGVQTKFTIASGAFPAEFKVKKTLEIVEGIRTVTHQSKAKYLGGDTNEADDIILSVVAAGTARKQEIIRRDGAQIGDIICTTGQFGLTGAGFKIFIDNFPASSKRQQRLFKEAVYNPKPRVHEGLLLASTGKIRSCIDSSDGLAWCLAELLRGKDNAGIIIDNLPIHPEVIEFASENKLEAEELALFAGEEFELVFTINPKELQSLEDQMKSQQATIYPIGKVTIKNPGKIKLERKGKSKEIIPRGWEHFLERKKERKKK